MSADQDPDEFVMSLDYIRRQLDDNGVVITDEDFNSHIVSKLPVLYSELVTQVEPQLEKISLQELQFRLQAFYRRRVVTASELSSSSDPSQSALAAQQTPSQDTSGRPSCTHCKKLGHTIDKCFLLHGKPPGWTPRKKGGRFGGRGNSHGGGRGGRGNNSKPPNVGFMAAIEPHAPPGREEWIVDSGCTSHMTSSTEGMINRRPFNATIATMDGVAQCTETGDIPGFIGDQPVTLYDVVVVPSMGSNNLFSVAKATNRGAEFSFGKTKAGAHLGPLFFPFHRNNQELWTLDFVRNKESANVAIDVNLLHQRLGHIGHQSVMQLARQLEVQVTGTLADCTSCELGKSRRAAISKRTDSPVSEPLELAHSDFIGPFPTASVGGAKYAQIVIDSYSAVATVSFHRTKEASSARNGLDAFIKRVSVPAQRPLKAIRTDCGGEFAAEFDARCLELRTVHQLAPPHTPQLNGKAERTLQTIIQHASCMLQHGRVPQSLWAEAINTSCYLYNRTPHSSLGGLTPFEVLTGAKPSIDHLRVFGSTCFLHVPKQQRRKLDPRAIACVFVGYSVNKPVGTYRIFNPQTRQVTESLHVVFHEGTLGEEQLNPGDLLGVLGPEGADSDAEDPAEATAAATAAAVAAAERTQDATPPAPLPLFPPPYRRYPLRETAQPERYQPAANLAVEAMPTEMAFLGTRVGDPASYDEAIASSDSDKWRQAVHEEMAALINNHTWDVVELPAGRNAIGTKWIFKTKVNSAGQVVRYKARLVVQGFTQQEGVDYFDTYAPVATITSVRTVLAAAAFHDWELEQLDVDTAFLNAPVEEDIYAAIPLGYQEPTPSGEQLVYKLRRSLYGLKQSPRNWNSLLNTWLETAGFERSTADNCLYTYSGKDGFLLVLVYVDDIILVSDSAALLSDFKAAISKDFNIKDLGQLNYFLGIRISRDRSQKLLTMDQQTYIKAIINKFGFTNSKAVTTPSADAPLVKGMAPASSADAAFMASVPYRSAVGSLLYLAIATRPDISNAVREVSRYMHNPGRAHWEACARIFRYLNGTSNLNLSFDLSAATNFNLIGYCDANHGGDLDTRRSTTGYLFLLGAAAVSWCSRLQSTVALSSTEAEYMALTEATNEAIFLRQLLSDIGIPQLAATTIFEDNQGAIKLANNPMHHRRSKHIDIKFHHIRHHINHGTICLEYVRTTEQLADSLTKGVGGGVLRELTNAIFTEA